MYMYVFQNASYFMYVKHDECTLNMRYSIHVFMLNIRLTCILN